MTTPRDGHPGSNPLNQPDYPKYRLAVKLVTFLIGIVCIMVALLAGTRPAPSWATGILSLGVALVTGTFVSSIDSWFGTDVLTGVNHLDQRIEQKMDGLTSTLDTKLSLYDAGIRGAYARVRECPNNLSLATAHHIDLLQNAGGHNLRNDMQDILTAVKEHQADVRILLSDPDFVMWKDPFINQVLAPDLGEHQTVRDIILGSIKQLQLGIQELPSTPGVRTGSITVKLFRGISPSNIIIVNNDLVRHIPRVMYRHTEWSPVFDIGGEGRLVAFYREAFQSAWKHSNNIERPDLCYPSPIMPIKQQNPKQLA